MREARPIGARHDLLEVAFDPHRVLLTGQAEPLREPPDVRVDDDALRVPELRRDDVRGLARDAGEANQLLERRGTSPSNSSMSILIVPRIAFAFWRKKPVA